MLDAVGVEERNRRTFKGQGLSLERMKSHFV